MKKGTIALLVSQVLYPVMLLTQMSILASKNSISTPYATDILPKGSWSEQQEAKRRASEPYPWTVTEIVRQTKPTSQEVSRHTYNLSAITTNYAEIILGVEDG